MLRSRHGTPTALALIGVAMLAAAMPGVPSYAAPAASAGEDGARSFDTQRAPTECLLSELEPRKTKTGKVFARASMNCREDPLARVRVIVRLQERFRSGGDFVFSTKRIAKATSLDWLSVRTLMPCHPGTFKTYATFFARFDKADPWHKFHQFPGVNNTIRRC